MSEYRMPPSKNVIHSARIAALFRRNAEFGITSGSISIDRSGVRRRKRNMVNDLRAVRFNNYRASGAESMAEGLTVLFANAPVEWEIKKQGFSASD